MLGTSARLLRLLSLLQTSRDWSGPQLAERLGVSTRTIRHDVGKLRELGYPVDATPGAAGGYRLGAGAQMPPLLLDDEEAVAVAVGLRTAAGGTVVGIEETSLRALAKLEQVLPARLRSRVNALHSATVAVAAETPAVSADVLGTVAAACRDNERLRFDYLDHDGAASTREVEPHRLVHAHRRWYLAAWDTARQDWRSFRVDRMLLRRPNGARFVPREAPGGDVATYVVAGVVGAAIRYRAVVRLHASAESLTGWDPDWGTLEAVDEHCCLLHTGNDSPERLALYLGMIGVDFDIVDAPGLADHLRELGARYTRAAG
ncbi:helix-turn-helix transcriptional regulator [Nocardiopsis ansamitocini]|uniref:DNA-binding transcriptional regulator n=1 Tax=Nocardiopsis ansamitocini TaxID=1670832 RepID=A0A9W6UH08_9ACTN|nr:YafY family protein [Nocardiopsis ansamitocini]GLU48316.1 DNA-binding transcriptional regulator [Nocardiopsis ansamitocini]